MATQRIDINADAGESFGRWTLGDDPELLRHVTSVNAACGFHAGDPSIMRATAALAKERGVALGAHPGLPDLVGFGRRKMAATQEQMVDMVLYQVGALQAFAAVEGVRLSHVKPHGALYGALMHDGEAAVAVVQAVRQLDPDLGFIMLAGSEGTRAIAEAGLAVVPEAFPDLEYDDSGSIIIEPLPGPRDPEWVADRALEMLGGTVTTVGGKTYDVAAQTLCLHGDRPNAVEVATHVKQVLTQRGYELRSAFAAAVPA